MRYLTVLQDDIQYMAMYLRLGSDEFWAGLAGLAVPIRTKETIGGQEDRVYKKKDWLQYTLDLPMVNDPGKVAHYCSMGVLLLTEIISQTSGMSIDSFADTYLFMPLTRYLRQVRHAQHLVASCEAA